MQSAARSTQWGLILAMGSGLLVWAGCHFQGSNGPVDNNVTSHPHAITTPSGKQFKDLGLDNCSAIPAGAIPVPNGTYVHAWQEAQANKAEADDFVFYRQEWCMGGHELGPFGRYHLHQVIKRLPDVPFPVVVQPALDHHLNESRRQLLVECLAMNGVPDADRRVIVAFPDAEGLNGEEAPIVYRQMIRGTGGFGGNTGIGGSVGGISGGFGGGIAGGMGGFGGIGGGLGGISGFGGVY
jgi:hypothetical protein